MIMKQLKNEIHKKYFHNFSFQSSSSSDSDFNDFHYLDQFLEEFYSSDTEQDNHLIITKSLSSDKPNNDDEISNNNNNKYPMNHHVLGQGDAIEQKTGETSEQPLNEKQYSIYQLLHRYENEILYCYRYFFSNQIS